MHMVTTFVELLQVLDQVVKPVSVTPELDFTRFV